MKPVSFATMKKLQRMSLNEFNRWIEVVYKQGAQDGIDFVEKETIAEIQENDLYHILLSVKGIGEKRALAVMKKIIGEDWEVSDVEGEG